MSTSCQADVSRAVSFSAIDMPLASDRGDILSYTRADRQALFMSVAGLTREYSALHHKE